MLKDKIYEDGLLLIDSAMDYMLSLTNDTYNSLLSDLENQLHENEDILMSIQAITVNPVPSVGFEPTL